MDYILAFFKPLGEALNDALGFIFFAFFGGVVRTIYRPSSRSVSAYAISIMVSVPVGVLAGNIAVEYGLTDNTAKSFAVVAGILAHDLIESVFWAADKVRSDRETIWKAIWGRFFGKKTD